MKYRIETRWFVLFREEAGVISEEEVWVCWLYGGGCWLYVHETLRGLAWQITRYWKDDRFLAG